MATVERRASVVWTGDVRNGSGTLGMDTSGACGELPIDLPTRAGEARGNTSPEELIAAAHAGCFAMALSSVLGADGNPPDRLEVSAVCTQGRAGDGFAITNVDLTVRGEAPGVDDEGFRDAARRAEQACPVSGALRGNVEIGLDASLAG